MNRARFQRMKRSAFFINIGRGMTTKLDDLVAALNAGRDRRRGTGRVRAGAAAGRHPLWTMPNVLMTPHMAGYGPYLNDRRYQIMIDNCRAFLGRQAVAQRGRQGVMVLKAMSTRRRDLRAGWPRRGTIVSEALEGAADAVYLPDLDDAARADALRNADAVLARTTRELRPGEIALLKDVRLMQFVHAGIDLCRWRSCRRACPSRPTAAPTPNRWRSTGWQWRWRPRSGCWWNTRRWRGANSISSRRNRMLAGGVCGILGFGGIGVAMARLARGIGMRVHAINRRGRSEEPTDWIGTTGPTRRAARGIGRAGDLHATDACDAGHDRCAAAGADEGRRDPGERRARRDRR